MVDLARGEQLQVHVRHRLVELRDDLDVVVEVDVRALAADHVDLGEAAELALAKRVLDELLGRVRVGAFLLLRDRERAELALHAADVRLVEVQVLDEVDLVVPAALTAREIGQLAEREDVVRLHQQEAVLEVEPLAGDDLLADALERRRCDRGSPLRSPVYHGFGNRLQLVARLEAVEARQCPSQRSCGRPAGPRRSRRSPRLGAARRRVSRPRAPRGRPRPPGPRAGAGASECPRGDPCRRSSRSRRSGPRSRGSRRRSGTRFRARARTRRAPAGGWREGRRLRRASPSSACSGSGTPRRWCPAGAAGRVRAPRRGRGRVRRRRGSPPHVRLPWPRARRRRARRDRRLRPAPHPGRRPTRPRLARAAAGRRR